MARAQLAGAAGALAVISALVVQTSSAAFTARTENAGNSWSAGTVALSDNDNGTAMFNESGLVPGRTGTRCIVVTYTGSVPSNVRLSAQITGGTGLGAYLDMTVARGTGSSADCSDFASTESVYTGTLDAMAATHRDFASGAGTWQPTTGQTATYRFRWTLRDDNAAQGRTVQSTFTWEAQNV